MFQVSIVLGEYPHPLSCRPSFHCIQRNTRFSFKLIRRNPHRWRNAYVRPNGYRSTSPHLILRSSTIMVSNCLTTVQYTNPCHHSYVLNKPRMFGFLARAYSFRLDLQPDHPKEDDLPGWDNMLTPHFRLTPML